MQLHSLFGSTPLLWNTDFLLEIVVSSPDNPDDIAYTNNTINT